MLPILLATLMAQTVVQLPLNPPVVSEAKAVATLVSARSKWEARSSALAALEHHAFTRREIRSLRTGIATAAHEPSGRCDSRTDSSADRCTYEIGPCLSPFGFILAAVDSTRANDAFVEVAVEVVDQRSDVSAVPMARRILAAARHQRAEAEARRLLETKSYDCAGEGALMLSQLPVLSGETQTAIEAQFQHGSPNALSLAGLVAMRPEPWAETLAVRMLRSADTHHRLGFIRGSQGRFPTSSPVVEALAFVARCDPARRLRDEATAVFALQRAKLPAVGCPVPEWRFADGAVTGNGRTTTLRTGSGAPAPSEQCLASAAADGRRALGMVGTACVVAENRGEFGGSLHIWREGTTELPVADPFLHPVALLRRGDDVLVVSALRHMSGSGGVGRIVQSAGEPVRYESLFQFLGLPVSWAVDGTRFFVAFEAGDFTSPCPPKGPTEQVALVFESDAGFSLARGEATGCLWPNP